MTLAVAQSLETIQLENASPDERGLIEFLCDSLAILWKDWSRDMNITVLGGGSNNQFSLRGKCPHCRENSVFILVTQPHSERYGVQQEMLYAVMQCQGCEKYILGKALKQNGPWQYKGHYPLGTPDDSVAKEVSEADPAIALDFSEALRCLWVKSYKASVAMCRRSVEASCKQLGATGRDLEKKIDNLAEQGKITEPLRQMAHAVRLTANRQLHGKKAPGTASIAAVEADEAVDDLDTFGEEDATAMIEFTKEYFHHVYVMPAKLKAYGKPKAKGEAVAEIAMRETE